SERIASIAEREDDGAESAALPPALTPYEEVRDFFYARHNYFDEVDRAAERIAAEAALEPGAALSALSQRLHARHDVKLVTERAEGEGELVERRYDPSTRTLSLPQHLGATQRAFQAATQLGLLEVGEAIERLADEGGFASDAARTLARIGLAHHFAGALIMP